jgi:hypothetical protein
MRLTRNEAMRALNGFAALDRGEDGKPFPLQFEVLVHVANVTRKLRAAIEAEGADLTSEERERRNRMFEESDRAVLAETISLKMPKRKLTLADLSRAKVAPGVLVDIAPFVDFGEFETDEDEDKF